VAGFIALEDGRAYAASNHATDAMMRSIADAVEATELAEWILSQQSEFVGLGMTCDDLREVAPADRRDVRDAIRRGYARARTGAFDPFPDAEEQYRESWLSRYADLVEMLDRSAAGEDPALFNPHMRDVLPATGRRAGPGWNE
jgi:hypothetical protein